MHGLEDKTATAADDLKEDRKTWQSCMVPNNAVIKAETWEQSSDREKAFNSARQMWLKQLTTQGKSLNDGYKTNMENKKKKGFFFN